MYERTYGKKYREGLWDVAVIAKLIRADIKDAIDAGCLPAGKYSVRSRKFSGGSAIDVEIKGLADFPNPYLPDFVAAWEACKAAGTPFNYNGWTDATLYIPQLLEARKTLRAIRGAYNYDGSEAMVDYFDVNYYGSVNIDYEWGYKLLGII
jgi:hypothetical protein